MAEGSRETKTALVRISRTGTVGIEVFGIYYERC